ncbi:MAG: heme ABC transporter permease [Pseudomonadales bacterium]
MMWSWFHKFGSPRWFYDFSTRLLPWLTLFCVGFLVLGLVWALAVAPADYKQGNSFRIFYIHVPTAVISLVGYYVMAIAGAISLIWRMKLADIVMKEAAPIGALLTFLALFTGAVWGKPTWGTWWVWDARVTSMLILFFLYVGVIALSKAFDNPEQSGKACAVLSLVGTVNIPIIYKSVDWWYSLHQPATIKFTEESTIHPDMFWPFLVITAGFYLFFALALTAGTRLGILQREYRTQWVRARLQE